MTSLTLIPRNSIRRFHHFSISSIFTFSVIITDTIINIMLQCNSISCTCWFIIYLKNLTCLWIKLYLRSKSLHGPVYLWPGNVQPPFGFGSLPIALGNIKNTSWCIGNELTFSCSTFSAFRLKHFPIVLSSNDNFHYQEHFQFVVLV